MSPSSVRLHAAPRGVKTLERNGDSLGALLRSARERGRAEGLAQGRALERSEATERLHAAADAVDRDREVALAALGQSAVELGTAIAKALLRTEIDAGNYDIEAMVRATLAEAVGERGACTVHLHPKDYARLEGVRFRTGTALAPDEEVQPGDVNVETSVGLLVRETTSAVAEIERRLLEDLS